MNVKVVIGVAIVIGLAEVVFIANPELWDDLMYSLGKIPQWFQDNNSWLPKPKPSKSGI